MKKQTALAISLLLVMSSCGSYEATGAYTGAQFGSIIGSAIGGISGGWRGRDVGTLIGMAGGAAVGAAIGKAADDKAEERMNRRPYGNNRYSDEQYGNDRYGNDRYGNDRYSDNQPGDDRIVFDEIPAKPIALEISHAHLIDTDHDGLLKRGESARVTFEIHNPSDQPAYGVQPSVTEVNGNKHVHISENILIERILPKQTMRYTAQIKADKGLKNGEAVIRLSVFQGGRELSAQSREFRVRTTK